MSFKHFKIFLLLIIGVTFVTADITARASQSEQHLEVSLRMIGHEVLLCLGDNTSRVLPIEKDSGRYKISFDTEFDFDPEDLVSTVTRVMEETQIVDNYILAVEECETGDLVYMFQIGKLSDPSIIPCRSRKQPKGCYSLVLTLMDDEGEIGSAISSNQITAETGFLASIFFKYLLIAILLASVVGIVFFLRKKWLESKVEVNPNVISLGDYQFDKRNTELLHEQKRIELTGKEANLLILLYDAVNTTMEREVILKKVWGDEGDYVGRTLDVFISKLRKKLEADPKVKIVNIRGVGYKLVIDV